MGKKERKTKREKEERREREIQENDHFIWEKSKVHIPNIAAVISQDVRTIHVIQKSTYLRQVLANVP